MKKLNVFLERIDFFATLVHVLWAVFVAVSLFAGYEDLVISVPAVVVFAGTGLCIAVGVFLQKRLMRDPKKRASIAAYLLFYYGVPILSGVLKLCFIESWYYFSSSLFPGLAALGFVITTFLCLGIALIGLLVFGIVWFVRRRREKRGRHGHPEFWRKVRYALNIISFWCISLAGAAFLICVGTEAVRQELHDLEVRRNRAYLEERIGSLCTLIHSQDTEDAARCLIWEGYFCSKIVEMMAQGVPEDWEENFEEGLPAGANDLLTFSHVTSGILEQGKKDYLEFTERYVPLHGVEALNQDIWGDAGEKTVSVSAMLSVHDVQQEGIFDAYMITTFDEEWNVIRVECRTEPPLWE